MVVGGTSPGTARPIHRMERGAASPQYPLHCLPKSLFNSALGPRPSFSVARFGTDGSDATARLGADLRPHDLLSGNVHGPGTLARDLLPCSELDGVGFDDRAWEGRQRSPAEPIAQAGVGVSAGEGFSAAISGAGMRRKPVSEWTMDELKQTLERVRTACGEEDYKLMNAVVETLSYLTHLAKDKQAAEIYRILGSSKSEKTRKILRVLQMESEPDAEVSADHQPRPTESQKKRKGHGRNSADDYTGARQIRVSLESMKPGDRCPCGKGNLYEVDDSPLVRIVGQAPLQADVYRLERLRCNTCGDVFTAKAPEGVGSEKYDV